MEQGNKLTLPVAVIIAGLLIAGAFYLSNKNKEETSPSSGPSTETTIDLDFSKDYVLGSREATIKLVEYSDLNCPFCRSFHPTLKRVMSEYGESGKVAWIYRHLAILGPDSVKQAQAAECAGELGDNEKFWQFIDTSFEAKEEGAHELPAGVTVETIAEQIGLDKEAFNACLKSGKYAEKVQKQTDEALAAGAKGTPFSLLVDSNKEITPIAGALPFEDIKAGIEKALAKLK